MDPMAYGCNPGAMASAGRTLLDSLASESQVLVRCREVHQHCFRFLNLDLRRDTQRRRRMTLRKV